MNVSATLNVLRLLVNPQLSVPHLAVSSFDKLALPLTFPANLAHQPSEKVDIRAIVLDKDNCFAKAHDDKVWPAYEKKWAELRNEYPGAKLLVVSNSAGTNDDIGHQQAEILENRLGVKVFKHTTKKPGCHADILDYFKRHTNVERPEHVAVIGDRLFTDVLMANMMGSWGIWIYDGVKRSESPICRAERWVYSKLTGVSV